MTVKLLKAAIGVPILTFKRQFDFMSNWFSCPGTLLSSRPVYTRVLTVLKNFVQKRRDEYFYNYYCFHVIELLFSVYLGCALCDARFKLRSIFYNTTSNNGILLIKFQILCQEYKLYCILERYSRYLSSNRNLTVPLFLRGGFLIFFIYLVTSYLLIIV